MAFEIKRGDRRPNYRVQLLSNGSPADLTGNQGVWFILKNSSNATVVNAAATVVDAAEGIVEYQWGSADTATAGDYTGEFEVAWGPTRTVTQTWPSKGYFTITIYQDLA